MRDLKPAAIAQLQAGQVNPILLVQVTTSTGDHFYWSGLGSIVWNGHTFLGAGKLGSISTASETSDLTATNLTLSMNGIPSDIVGLALNECRTNLPAILWFGFLDAAGAVVADPYEAFSGRVDVPSAEEGGDNSTISITVENDLVDMHRPRASRYTQADQQNYSPGDLGFNFVSSVQNWNGKWGQR